MAVSPEATDATILFLLAATGLVSVSFVLMSVALSAAVAAAVPPDRLLLGTTQARSAQLAARALGGLVLSVLLYATRTPVILLLVAALTLILWLACERVLGASRQVIPPSDDNESALKVFVRAVRDCKAATTRPRHVAVLRNLRFAVCRAASSACPDTDGKQQECGLA